LEQLLSKLVSILSIFLLQKTNFTMNWLHRKVPALVSAIAIIMIAVIGCRKEDPQIITNELRVTASNELYLNPLNIQLFDAKNEYAYPANATVTVVGKDRTKILSVLGDRIIPTKEGIIEIGVRRHEVPSETRPLEFSLVIEAPGYLKAIKSYYLTSATEPIQDEVRLYRLADLPTGAESAVKTATVPTDCQVTSNIDVSVSGLSVRFKPGTIFRSALRRVLSGEVKVSLVRFDASQETALEGFPGGLTHDNAKNERGNDLGEGIFTPYGFYQLDVTVGGVPAKFVSTPIEVTMDIPASIKRGLDDSNTPVAIQSGNNIDIWSFDETEQVWRQEGKGRVIPGGLNNLQVKFTQSHLSFWSIADRRADRACLNPGFRANYTTTPAATPNGSAKFFVRVRAAFNPQIVLTSFYVDLSNNPFIDMRRMVRRTNQSVILDFSASPSGASLYRTAPFVPCSRPTINLIPLATAWANGNYFNFVIDVNTICGTTSFRPYASVYAAVANAPGGLRYQYIGTMQNGILRTALLQRGVPYVFKMVRGPLSGTTIQLNNPTITFPTDRSIQSCTLFFTNTLWGLNNYPVTANVLPANSNTFVFSLPNFQAPAYMCNKWFQYF
jgi:hypothetical protein